MSIWGVKLSTWIDKDSKNCDYKSFVKMLQNTKCRNPKCTHKVGYGMWDLHSAPYGHGDGPFCSNKCMCSRNGYSRKGKVSKKKLKLRRLARVSMLLKSVILDDKRKKDIPIEYGVTLEEVKAFDLTRPINEKAHKRAETRHTKSWNKKFGR